MSDSIAQCRAGNRCNKWKVCPECSAIRQARIANIAESGSLKSPFITFAVVRPLQGTSFVEEKTSLIKAINKNSDGGIWTIETGQHTGLHTNLVIGSSEPFDMNIIYSAIKTESSVFGKTISHKDVRNVSSYISKKEGYPENGEYKGRIYGSFGTFKKPLALAFEQDKSPIIKVMAMEKMLIDADIPKPESKIIKKPLSGNESKEDTKSRSIHNAKAIDKHHDDIKNWERQKAHYDNMQRQLAILADEISIKGIAYLKGYGVVTEKDLREWGIVDRF